MMCAKDKETFKILKINDLSVTYKSDQREVLALDSLSLDIHQGEFFSIVGESGSGKSTLAMALMQLLTGNALVNGDIVYKKVNGSSIEINTAKDSVIRSIRASELAMIFQEPAASFNPVYTVGYQLNEVIKFKKGIKKRKQIKDYAYQCLTDAGLDDVKRVYKSYPHQLSGGMLQRVMIAQALAATPKVLIADEATSSLDVTIQSKILNLLKKLNKEYDLTVIFITHDLDIALKCSDKIAVLADGKLQDLCKANELALKARSEYTRSLISAFSRMGEIS